MAGKVRLGQRLTAVRPASVSGRPARSCMLKATDYRAELERIEKAIADLQGDALVPPTDTEKVTTYWARSARHPTRLGR